MKIPRLPIDLKRGQVDGMREDGISIRNIIERVDGNTATVILGR
jgi:hypothetical protein